LSVLFLLVRMNWRHWNHIGWGIKLG